MNEHLASIADSQRTPAIASRLYSQVENTAFLFFELIGLPDPGLPDCFEETDRRALLSGLVEQCAELALAPDTLEVPVYVSYALFDAQNAVRLHRLADETAAVWRDLERPLVRARTIVHLHARSAGTGSTCRSGPTCLIPSCRKTTVRCGRRRMCGCSRPTFLSNGRARC
ncbi:MAG: hypothetical protein U0361_07010 [Nitrospiraceae bacterium]